MKFRIYLLASILLLPWIGHSQNLYTLSGHVVDENRKIVAIGEATLLRESDSATIKTAVITDGEFIMDTTRAGLYLLQITATGFRHHLIKVRLDESKLIPISLVSDAGNNRLLLSYFSN